MTDVNEQVLDEMEASLTAILSMGKAERRTVLAKALVHALAPSSPTRCEGEGVPKRREAHEVPSHFAPLQAWTEVVANSTATEHASSTVVEEPRWHSPEEWFGGGSPEGDQITNLETQEFDASTDDRLVALEQAITEYTVGWRDLVPMIERNEKLIIATIPVLDLVANAIASATDAGIEAPPLPAEVARIVYAWATATMAERVAIGEFQRWAITALARAASEGDERARMVQANLSAVSFV